MNLKGGHKCSLRVEPLMYLPDFTFTSTMVPRILVTSYHEQDLVIGHLTCINIDKNVGQQNKKKIKNIQERQVQRVIRNGAIKACLKNRKLYTNSENKVMFCYFCNEFILLGLRNNSDIYRR